MFGIYDNHPYWYDNGSLYEHNTININQASTPFLLGFNWATPAASSTFTSQLNGMSETNQANFDTRFQASGPLELGGSTTE